MRSIIRFNIIILILSAWTATAQANHQHESEPLTLQGFVSDALKKNPGLQVKKKEYEALRARA